MTEVVKDVIIYEVGDITVHTREELTIWDLPKNNDKSSDKCIVFINPNNGDINAKISIIINDGENGRCVCDGNPDNYITTITNSLPVRSLKEILDIVRNVQECK